MFSNGKSALAATGLLLTLANVASSCFTVTGIGSSSYYVTVALEIEEDGEKVCDFSQDGSDGYHDCGDGYKVDYDWGVMEDPIWVKFHSIKYEKDWEVEVDVSGCDSWNCCSPTVPCSCTQCKFEIEEFCD
ncbi:hypothetical protein FQN54_004414 [Arachnomyces sp. PD_36]|nr:hypothetical protein FQN54_004414 [Arachnomyces sp. PD_36]